MSQFGSRTEIINAFLTEMSSRCGSKEHLQYLYDFITTGYAAEFITDKNLPYVVKKLMKIEKFGNLAQEQRNIFGATGRNDDSTSLLVAINPELDPYRRELYAFHELTHVVLDGNSDKMSEIARNAGASLEQQSLFADGYTVIEEAVAQNTAEQMMAILYGRTRKAALQTTDKAIPGISFSTNFDYYGLYQPIATSFARTLRGIGNLPSRGNDDTYLNALSARAFNSGFAEDIVKEYKSDGHFKDLAQSFIQLGRVYRAKQAFFGVGTIRYDVSQIRQDYLQSIATFNALEEHRPQRDRHEI